MADRERNFDRASDDLNRAGDKAARAADKALGPHDEPATTGDVVGETIGGVSGIAAGAAIGSLAGPVGTVIGALAGAVGGWWAGRAVSEAASTFTDADDTYYRRHFESSRKATAGSRAADADYDAYRPAYQLGQVASRNPDYAERNFDAVEGDLRRGWTPDVSARYGDWDKVRDRARAGFEYGRERLAHPTDASLRTDRPIVTQRGMETSRPADTVAGAAASEADRAGNAIERGARKVGDKLDDLKDRVDANPASRPGPDPTDSPRRL
ncbi:MAG TPA: glycine zipper domain-containing protein [Gemmatimonadaceae bacterium]|nr:glycine zipper domain-containing protein [Gemmatimonadaceae bacterium]